jgi:hypothetical protein
MLWLGKPSQTNLQQFIEHVGTSKAKCIRQLIARAEPEDFPLSWQMKANERQPLRAREGTETTAVRTV